MRCVQRFELFAAVHNLRNFSWRNHVLASARIACLSLHSFASDRNRQPTPVVNSDFRFVEHYYGFKVHSQCTVTGL